LTAGSYPQALADVNGELFFAADNGTQGMELWKSDGTGAGTALVKELVPGSDGGYPYGLIGVGSTLFFAAGDGINGTELWKSDGTSAGTTMVKDIWAGSGDSYPFSLKSVGGELYFSADNGTKGDELWKSDGTSSGTTMVKDIWPGIQSGAAGNFAKMINRLLFTGNDGISGYTTWESDGSAAGTKIASIGAPGSMLELAETDTIIFASISATDVGRELWVVNYSSVLPLCVLEFKGWVNDDDAILNWKTDNESNTDKFIVERSINGTQYTPVGSVRSANSPGVHTYAYTDDDINSLGTDIVYYRLKQIDIDGHYTYSKIVTLPLRTKSRLMLFPNPATNQLNLTLSLSRKEKLNYQVFDNAGRLVIQHSTDLLAGINSLPVDIGSLAAGVYYLNLFNNSFNERLKFVKR
jgi:ELWxxDGT repeat protein